MDADTGKERRPWRLDTGGLLGRRGGLNPNEGFEGLAFRPDAARLRRAV